MAMITTEVKCPNCDHEFEWTFEHVTFTGEDTPLRKARREKGLSLNKAAEAAGISVRAMRRLEQNIGNPRFDVVRRICALYGKSMDELFPVPGTEDPGDDSSADDEDLEDEDE